MGKSRNYKNAQITSKCLLKQHVKNHQKALVMFFVEFVRSYIGRSWLQKKQERKNGYRRCKNGYKISPEFGTGFQEVLERGKEVGFRNI